MSFPTSQPRDNARADADPARWADNPQRDPDWACAPVDSRVRDFHRTLSGYAPTGLTDLPDLARQFGVRHVYAKDESNRLGLPAFKALGASWAIHRALLDRVGEAFTEDPVTVVAATDGNHGRAVAHFARQFGHGADIFLPEGVHPSAVQAIRDEGATVTVLPGSYDDAVAAAAQHVENSAGDGVERLLVQDTAWDGYEDVPGWIVDGYSTLFAEVDDQLSDHGIAEPDLVVVPTGVGSLLQAAIAHYRSDASRLGTAIVSVEPTGAACVLSSVISGSPVTVETGHTVMTGLNCGTMSSLAWPYISPGLDVAVAVTDGEATTAAGDLAALGVGAGPCGAASLAAIRVLHNVSPEDITRVGLSTEATIVLLVTEGAEANPWLSNSGNAD